MLSAAYETNNTEPANLDSTLAKRLMDKGIRLRLFAREQMSRTPENGHVRKPPVEDRGHGKMPIWNYRGVKNATALCRVGTHVLTVLFSSESLPPGFIVGRFVRPALRKSNIALSTVPLQPRRRQASGHVFAAVQK
jgi:hypothetical protein